MNVLKSFKLVKYLTKLWFHFSSVGTQKNKNVSVATQGWLPDPLLLSRIRGWEWLPLAPDLDPIWRRFLSFWRMDIVPGPIFTYSGSVYHFDYFIRLLLYLLIHMYILLYLIWLVVQTTGMFCKIRTYKYIIHLSGATTYSFMLLLWRFIWKGGREENETNKRQKGQQSEEKVVYITFTYFLLIKLRCLRTRQLLLFPFP